MEYTDKIKIMDTISRVLLKWKSDAFLCDGCKFFDCYGDEPPCCNCRRLYRMDLFEKEKEK